MSDLTSAEKLRILRNMVRIYKVHALEQEIDAASKLAAAEEGERLWRANEDNTFGRCPYNAETARTRLQDAKAERLKMEQVDDFVVDVYVDKSTLTC
jgi:hypothetical protein